MHQLFDLFEIIRIYGYIGLFLITFLESSFFFPLPGDSLLFTAGLLATKHLLNIYILIPLFFTATFTGSILGYWIGERIVELRKYKIVRTLIKQKHLDEVHAFFEKYGLISMIFTRYVPIVRTFAPICAGLGKMEYKKFLQYNVIGAFIWSTTTTLAGFFLGRAFPQIQEYMSLMIVVIIFVSIIPALVHMYQKQMAKRRKFKELK